MRNIQIKLIYYNTWFYVSKLIRIFFSGSDTDSKFSESKNLKMKYEETQINRDTQNEGVVY